MQNDSQSGLLWFFFVPTYEEILGSTDGKKMIDSFVLAATESKAKLIDA